MKSNVLSESKKEVAIAIGILFIATCLRAPFTCIGPLLKIMQESLHLSTAATGLVNALPLLAFAVVSPLAPLISSKLGLERTISMALVLVGVGVALRAFGYIWSLYVGTGFIGCGIAICNVLLPSLVKRDFPGSIPRLTALYALTMGLSAALGSMLVVPLAESFNWGWELASATLFLLPFVSWIIWIPQMVTPKHSANENHATKTQRISLWKCGLAWQVTLFFGLTSLTYYVSVSWMPALLKDAGFTDTQAGNVHGLMQLASAIPGLLLIPAIKRMKDQRLIAVIIAAITMLGAMGLAMFPRLGILWGPCIGFGAGAAIVLGLMFIGLRSSNTLQAATLSGMAQSIGYLLAACGPICAGILHDITQSWTVVFYLCGFLCILLALAGLGAGRNIHLSEYETGSN